MVALEAVARPPLEHYGLCWAHHCERDWRVQQRVPKVKKEPHDEARLWALGQLILGREGWGGQESYWNVQITEGRLHSWRLSLVVTRARTRSKGHKPKRSRFPLNTRNIFSLWGWPSPVINCSGRLQVSILKGFQKPSRFPGNLVALLEVGPIDLWRCLPTSVTMWWCEVFWCSDVNMSPIVGKDEYFLSLFFL